jgi:hypothetical protein
MITNYHCGSRCAHCVYSCAPERKKDYIDAETARDNFRRAREAGCASVHIGGGEPFLNPEGLLDVLDAAAGCGVGIEYIETNSAWVSGSKEDRELLRLVKLKGVDTLLISISPFHNEYIPFSKPRRLMLMCQEEGLRIFPWTAEFISEVSSFDESRTHSLEEYRAKYGEEWMMSLPERYFLKMRGRCLDTFRFAHAEHDAEEIASARPRGCHELTDVTHFHIDLYGNYLPGMCAGIAIKTKDLGKTLSAAEYPLAACLHGRGVGGLYQEARLEYGFSPSRKYVSKCDLCQDIRAYISEKCGGANPELQPYEFYRFSGPAPERSKTKRS